MNGTVEAPALLSGLDEDIRIYRGMKSIGRLWLSYRPVNFLGLINLKN
jgi:hypothetical protein